MSCRFVVITLLLAAAPATAAHAFHASMAEIEWNADAHRFEVALKLDGPVLDDALSLRYGKRIKLETETESDALLHRYLAGRFHIRMTDRALSAILHWVGHESERHAA